VVGTPPAAVRRRAAALNGAAVASAPAPPAPTAPAAGRPVTPPRGARASAEGALAGATTAPAAEPATVGPQAAAHGPIAWSQADPDPGAGDRHQTPRHDVGDRLTPISPVFNPFTVQQADASADVQAPRPVAAPPLGEQVVQAARLVVTDGLSQMDVRLDPPELGGIRVTATVGPDGIGLTITADRVETHALLVHALPEIQTLLAERGVPAAAVAVAATSDPPAERRAPNRREPDRGSRGSQTPTDSRRPLAPRRAVGTVDLTV
jgi:flagellar hook-length control protein FliK